jgi:hypothetical protein
MCTSCLPSHQYYCRSQGNTPLREVIFLLLFKGNADNKRCMKQRVMLFSPLP